MDEDRLTVDYTTPRDDSIKFDPYAVHMQDSTGRVLNSTIDEIIDLFLFVKKLKQGEDEIIKLLENRYENAVKKK